AGRGGGRGAGGPAPPPRGGGAPAGARGARAPLAAGAGGAGLVRPQRGGLSGRAPPHREPERRPGVPRLSRLGPSPARVIFVTLFAAYSYFHQGGGWNQNSRFDQTRAIVETGSLAINDFMVYGTAPEAGGADHLRRLPLAQAS